MKTKLVVVLDPSIAGFNKGDDVISEAVIKEINKLGDNIFISRFSTKQNISYLRKKKVKNASLFIIAGSNMLNMQMTPFFGSKRFSARVFDLGVLKNVVLCGVGWQNEKKNPNYFGHWFYKKLLAKNLTHSVRDDLAKNKMNEYGFKNVVNTSCPSMWGLTKTHLEKIPTQKGKNVVFSLTSNKADFKNDLSMVKNLKKIYNKVFFFPQAYGDVEYFLELGCDGVEVLKPELEVYDKLLAEDDIDYVGTRLHGGIRALQKKCRTLIIAVDHRAREIGEDTGLPVLSRKDIEQIPDVCSNKIEAEIQLPLKKINEWKEKLKQEVFEE